MTVATPGRVLVFARAPEPGATKTRLIPALGAEGAARLSERLLRRTLDLAREFKVELWCTPSADHPAFARSQRVMNVVLKTQRGADLGLRMLAGLESALAEAPWALLIGTDCPELTAADLHQAAGWLEGGADAVLGPAADGGYYLIALRRARSALFTGVSWGTERVLEQTRARLTAAGCRWQELPVRRDLDRPEDLNRFPWLRERGGLAC